MTSSWIPRVGGFVTLLLVGLALALLQVSIAANGLLFYLPCYALVAIAALIAFATLRVSSGADLLCLCMSGLFGGYIAIRALTSPAPYFARADLYLVLAALTIYGLTVTALSSSARRIALIIALLAFALCHVLVSLIQFGIGQNFIVVPFLQSLPVGERARGLYENPDHLAGLLEILGILGLSIACWSRWPGWAKVLIGYLALVSYIGVALTASRGGYLSVAASLIIFAALSLVALWAGGPSVLRKYGAIGLIVLTAAFIAAGSLMHQSSSLSERLTNIVAPDNTRFDLWRASIEQWKLQPLTGTGSGTYRFYGRQFRTERMQMDPVVVHNDYLHLLCEYGLVGAVAFLLFFFAHLLYGWRNFVRFGPKRLGVGSSPLSDRLALNIGAISAIGAYVVHSAVDFNMHVPANALLIAFVFGILANPGMTPDSKIPRTRGLVPRLAFVMVGVILLFQCIRLLPGEYFAERASIALEGDDPAAAVSMANKALIYEQQNPNIFFYLGRALGALGNEKRRSEKRNAYHDAALAAFDKAHLLAPLDGNYPLDMAYAYDEMGRFAEAEWMYGVARSRDPRSVMMSQLYQSHLEAWENDGRKNVADTPDLSDPTQN